MRYQQFARWFVNKNIEDIDFLKYVLFTDETTINRGGAFNTHNLQMSQNENPQVVHQSHHQHRFSVYSWVGIIGNNFVSPYLLPTRLIRELCELFLRQALPELLDVLSLCIRCQMWFQQDDAYAHASRNVRQYLDNTFTNI